MKTLLNILLFISFASLFARELEYPSLDQKKGMNCDDVALANIAQYWVKKGLIQPDSDPYYYGTILDNKPVLPFKDKNLRFIKIYLLGFWQAKVHADAFLAHLVKWFEQDDNVGCNVTLTCPYGHSVAVESIIAEKNRFVMTICSWGEKFIFEIPRPARWVRTSDPSESWGIRGKVIGGNPKDAKLLYDDATGGEKGPNVVRLQFSRFYTILPVEVIKKNIEYFVEKAKNNEMVDENELHPAIAISVLCSPLPALFGNNATIKTACSQYPFLAPYVNRMQSKLVPNQNSLLYISPKNPLENPPPQETVADSKKPRVVPFSKICGFPVTEEQFQYIVKSAKEHDNIIVVDDRKKK